MIATVPSERVAPRSVGPLPRAHRARGRAAEWIFGVVIHTAAAIAILSILLIFVFVLKEALPLLTGAVSPGHGPAEVTWSSLAGPTEYPDRPARHIWQPVSPVPRFNLLPLVVGTLKTTIIAVLFAAPLAILAAILTAELAPRWVGEVVKPAIELLAGIPSVVLGFFCLMVLASWLQAVLGTRYRLNALTAGIGLGLAVIPIIFTVAEDALAAVPRAYREGALALGATRWETAIRVVVPAALPGIFAGVVLGFGRAVGETMIVLMASGNAALSTWSPTDSVRTLSATIAAELGEVVFGSAHYRVLFLLGVLLFVFTFAVNFAGARVVRRLQTRFEGRA